MSCKTKPKALASCIVVIACLANIFLADNLIRGGQFRPPTIPLVQTSMRVNQTLARVQMHWLIPKQSTLRLIIAHRFNSKWSVGSWHSRRFIRQQACFLETGSSLQTQVQLTIGLYQFKFSWSNRKEGSKKHKKLQQKGRFSSFINNQLLGVYHSNTEQKYTQTFCLQQDQQEFKNTFRFVYQGENAQEVILGYVSLVKISACHKENDIIVASSTRGIQNDKNKRLRSLNNPQKLTQEWHQRLSLLR